MKHRIFAAPLLALTLVIAPACQEAEDPPVPIATSRGELIATQSFQGELSPKKTTPIVVPKVPKVDVFTIKTILSDGATVKKGDVVATFDTTEIEDNLRSAESELRVAEASRAKVEHALATERIGLELEVKRRQMAVEEAKLRLVEGVNLISELERKKAQVNLESAGVELVLARSALEAFAKKRATSLVVEDVKIATAKTTLEDTRAALQRLTLRAPEDGVIYRPYVQMNFTRAKAEPGRVCRASDKILELPDLSTFEIILQVRPRDAARFAVGDVAKVYLAAEPNRAVPAKVAKKESFATTRNERYGTKTPEGNLKEIAITLELGEQLPGMRPGGTVRAEVQSSLAKDVAIVPLLAVDEEGETRFVTLAGGERRTVVLGATTATHGEVKEGLSGTETLWITPRKKKKETSGAAR